MPRPLWPCPDCGRTFANRGQVHTCRAPGTLDRWFDRTEPQVRDTFDAFVAAVERCGPAEIIPETTRIAFHRRMSFAVVVPRRRWLNGHLVLAERVEAPCFHRVTTYSARNHTHEFRLHAPGDVGDDLRRWIAAAYEVGEQRHLARDQN